MVQSLSVLTHPSCSQLLALNRAMKRDAVVWLTGVAAQHLYHRHPSWLHRNVNDDWKKQIAHVYEQ